MTDQADPLIQFSGALAARTEAAKTAVAAIRLAHERHLTGLLWQADIVVASEQSLPRGDEFELVAPGGATVAAKVAGRDASTNIAVLKLAKAVAPPSIVAGEARTGARGARDRRRRCRRRQRAARARQSRGPGVAQ